MQFGREKIEGTEHARVYHTRELLGPVRTPWIVMNVHSVEGMLMLEAQQRGLMELAGVVRADKPLMVDYAESEHPVASLARGITGVEFVLARGYSLLVVKARMFEWDEIEPGILEILRCTGGIECRE